MKIKLLGTAAAEGYPGLFCSCEACERARALGGKDIRTRSCAMINDSFLIDMSPDINMQSLKYGIKLSKLKSLIITHSHSDHIALTELALRSTEYFCHIPETQKLHVYCNEKVKGLIDNAIVSETKDAIPFLVYHVLKPFESQTVEGVTVTPLPATHDNREDCFIFLLEQDGKTFLYCNDTEMPPKETVDFLKNKKLDAIGFDCTVGRIKGKCRTHMSFEENVSLKDELAASGSVHKDTFLYITHFSHNCRDCHDELLELAVPQGFNVAYDGMEVII